MERLEDYSVSWRISADLCCARSVTGDDSMERSSIEDDLGTVWNPLRGVEAMVLGPEDGST